MKLEFPYQLVTFLSKEPAQNESVYDGENGWYAQLALKRRFKLNGIDEQSFIQQLKEYFGKIEEYPIETGELVSLERMPVRVIEVLNQDSLKNFHTQFIDDFKDEIISRYPERDGANYLPHITAEYYERFVIPVGEYTNKTFSMSNVWLLKDVSDENSVAYEKIK